MKRVFWSAMASVVATSLWLPTASAGQGEGIDRLVLDRPESTAPPRRLPDPPPVAPGEPPRAQTGFQVAFRTGMAIPTAKITQGQGNAMNDAFAWQVPLLVEIGGKPLDELFVGAYAGIGFGGAGSSVASQCSAEAVSCSSRTLRVGIEGIVYLLPSRRIDPWIGYGIGLEKSTLVAEKDRAVGTVAVSGLELAHLMAGFDARITHYVGIGPYADVALGRYSSIQRDPAPIAGARDADVAHAALHAWVTLGARLVVFP